MWKPLMTLKSMLKVLKQRSNVEKLLLTFGQWDHCFFLKHKNINKNPKDDSTCNPLFYFGSNFSHLENKCVNNGDTIRLLTLVP